MPVSSEYTPSWLDPLPKGFLTSSEWERISTFFFIEAPCLYQSARRVAIESLWGEKPLSNGGLKKILQEEILEKAPLLLKICEAKDLEACLEKEGLQDDFYQNVDRQIAVFVKVKGNGNDGTWMSFFYHLRNAIAHGRFTVAKSSKGRKVLIFEDVKPAVKEGRQDVSARGVVEIDLLLRIADVIKRGPERSL